MSAEILGAKSISARILGAKSAIAKIQGAKVLDAKILSAEVLDAEIMSAEILGAEIHGAKIHESQDLHQVIIFFRIIYESGCLKAQFMHEVFCKSLLLWMGNE